VDEERVRRYRDKMEHAAERLDDVADWFGDARTDLKSRLAVYKAFQEACEAMADLAAMAAVDGGVTVKDDYVNLDTAVKVGVALGPNLALLKQATGCGIVSCTNTTGSTTPRPSTPSMPWRLPFARSSWRWKRG
jgi:uncharacterized protein YutE (UPF0331/DUF86 family)